jgi:hypothetical protein
VLTGSLARDEGTCVEDGQYSQVLGDAEFLLVFKRTTSLPPEPALELIREQIEQSLLRRGIRCHVGLSAVHPRFFGRLRPAIFAYELLAYGQVIWGDCNILALVPRFSAGDIPLEDAWRLLSNRMIELLETALLENREQVTGDNEERSGTSDVLPTTSRFSVPCSVSAVTGSLSPVPSSVPYAAVKLYLDMATSFLLFKGAYEPTYRQREAKLRTLAENAGNLHGYPFSPLRRFSQRVTVCTELKLGTAAPAITAISWEEMVADARALWRWEMERLTGSADAAPRNFLPNLAGADAQSPLYRLVTFHSAHPGVIAMASRTPTDRELMKRWMRHQGPAKRLRGWAYVLRKCGWYRSWREWPRWLRLGWKASPRYWVYAAANELFFRLPGLLKDATCNRDYVQDCAELLAWLPLSALLHSGAHGQSSAYPDRHLNWKQVAAEIGGNYKEFVQGTRA